MMTMRTTERCEWWDDRLDNYTVTMCKKGIEEQRVVEVRCCVSPEAACKTAVYKYNVPNTLQWFAVMAVKHS